MSSTSPTSQPGPQFGPQPEPGPDVSGVLVDTDSVGTDSTDSDRPDSDRPNSGGPDQEALPEGDLSEGDLDGDGYPTAAVLDKIANFHGTPRALVELLSQSWAYAPPQVTKVPDWLSREDLEVDCVTYGWSGNESLIEALRPTMFWLLFWESSHRGGRCTFRVKTSQWDTLTLSPLNTSDRDDNRDDNRADDRADDEVGA